MGAAVAVSSPGSASPLQFYNYNLFKLAGRNNAIKNSLFVWITSFIAELWRSYSIEETSQTTIIADVRRMISAEIGFDFLVFSVVLV